MPPIMVPKSGFVKSLENLVCVNWTPELLKKNQVKIGMT